MANYNVAYQRPAQMLLSLRDELNAVFPGRSTAIDGFVSGYDGPNNPTYGISAHNANNLGHCMAFDITTLPGVHIDEWEGRALAEYLRAKMNENFAYLIHDMSEGAPAPKIAGNQTNWAWVTYGGIDAHSNHIHISLTNDYAWGESCGLAQSVYDSDVYWGIKEWYASYKNGTAPSKPAPKPPVAPQPALQNRVVTNPVAYVRTAPRANAPLAPGYPSGLSKGSVIAVKGYVSGQDPYGTGDNAWYVTKSGYYVWANAAQNTLAGLTFIK